MSRTAGLLLCLLLAPSLLADEAVPRAGSPLPGKLTFNDKGRLFFQPADSTEPQPLTHYRLVRCTPTVAPVRAAVAVHAVFPGEQQVTGQLDRCADGRLKMTTAWGTLDVPMQAVASLGPRPGWRIVEVDDFQRGFSGWKVGGKPAVQRSGMVLTADQSLTKTFATPLTAGRFSVDVRPDGGSGELLVLLGGGKSAGQVRIKLGEKAFEVQTDALQGKATPIAMRPDWQRLVVELGPAGLRVWVGAELLWQSTDSVDQLRITGVELRSTASTGSVLFTSFGMEHALPSLRRPPGSSVQDEVWLVSGDQVFGNLVSADGQGVTLAARKKERTFAWADVRGVFPAHQETKSVVLTGEQVRLELENTLQTAPDRLLGVVVGLDATKLELETSLFGKLAIPRAAIRALEGLGHGRRDHPGVPPR